MQKVTVRLPIEPQPKGRPRFRVTAGRVFTYTPKKTEQYENDVIKLYRQMTGGYMFPKKTPLHVALVFGMPIPKSTPKKYREQMINQELGHTKKPDVDNLAKSVLDALNGIAYPDDSQIVSLNIKKVYAEEPHVWVMIREEDEEIRGWI